MNQNQDKTVNSPEPTWKVKRVLDRNRSLLKALRHDGCQVADQANEWLARRGFNFQYHTHLMTTDDGKLVVMCYDEGYVVEEGCVTPISK